MFSGTRSPRPLYTLDRDESGAHIHLPDTRLLFTRWSLCASIRHAFRRNRLENYHSSQDSELLRSEADGLKAISKFTSQATLRSSGGWLFVSGANHAI
jgi:hypothetical protein